MKQMKTQIALILLASCATAAAEEPATAELPGPRVFRVALIEANLFMGDDGEVRLAQWVFWSTAYDRHARRHDLVDRGWKPMAEAILTGEPGAWAVEFGDVRIEAPELLQTVTNVDAQTAYRTSINTIR